MLNFDQQIADRLAALGNIHRLAIIRTLVGAGMEGMPVGKVQEAVQIPNSTLSHHISTLVNAGLVEQKRQGRTLYCTAQFRALNDIMFYLRENCSQSIDML